jgi:hypothetical protein
MNPTRDIQVPRPDAGGKKARFYYDSRPPPDPTWASAPANRSGGDTLITDSPPGVKWVAVGGFQEKAFDPAAGTVDLTPVRPGVLAGELVTGRDLAAGWEWKVLEKKGTYDGARKFGPNGWSITPCDSSNMVVPREAPAGSRIQLVFHAHLGRLQTIITPPMGQSDGPGPGADMRREGAGDQGGDPAEGPDLSGQELPGVRCNCRLDRAQAPSDRPGPSAALLAGLALAHCARRRCRRLRHDH